MSVKILFVDLRTDPIQLTKFDVRWRPGLVAREAVESTLGGTRASQIVADLSTGNKELIIAWNNLVSGEHSNIGGVNSLEWQISDHSIISIVYEDENVNSDKSEAAIQWMLNQEKS
ncbi:MAG TPA: hypothetical protein V6D48_23670 [Oculatellaceae cyanobacterium]